MSYDPDKEYAKQVKAARKDAIDILSNRQKTYVGIFEGEGGKLVLEDLKRFCRAEQSCFHADPRIHAALEGRREVILRILDHLVLTPEDFVRKYMNIKSKEIE